MREKSKRVGKEKPVALPALSTMTSSWTAHTLLIKRWEQLSSAFFPQGSLWLDTCQIEPFILLFWLGLNYWKGEERKIVGTLGIKINLTFIEKTTYVHSNGRTRLGLIWLRRIH